MQVIVTGSEGFVGKALVAALERRGVQVISIDRKFQSTHPRGVRRYVFLCIQTEVFTLFFLLKYK